MGNLRTNMNRELRPKICIVRSDQKALDRADRIDKMNIKILGKIKNRFDDDRIEMPEDIWTNNKYRIRLDQTGEWERVSYDIGVASIIELGIVEE